MPFDYQFTQKYINFGRGLAGKFVGQPFLQYRVTSSSSGDVVSNANLLVPNDLIQSAVSAKISAENSRKLIENENLHSDTFQVMASSETLHTEDFIVQHDDHFGGNSIYCIATRRPLKAIIAVRAHELCKIYRYKDNRNIGNVDGPQRGWGGSTIAAERPFILQNGTFITGQVNDTPTIVPCGITYIGQIKNRKPTNLPEDPQTAWWYVFVPFLPGLNRLLENDIIEHHFASEELPARFRIHSSYPSEAGLRGVFCLCERVTG